MSKIGQQVDGATVGLLVDYVVGTRSETARHLIARQAFLRAFLNDARVTGLFDAWLDRIDLKCLRDYLEITVQIEKADHWSDGDTYPLRNGVDLWSNERLLESLPSPKVGPDGVDGGPFERALKHLGESSSGWDEEDGADWPDFAAEAERFVIGLNVPYPWLVLALLREFLVRFVVFERIDDPSPITSTRFGTVRWRGHGWSGAARPDPLRFVADPDIPDVAAPVREALERKAVWFYRSTVVGEPLRALARSEFGDEADDRRKDVRVGVGVIRHLFDLRPRHDAELMTNGWMLLALDLLSSR